MGIVQGFDGYAMNWIALRQSISGKAKLTSEPAEAGAALGSSSLSPIPLPCTNPHGPVFI